jgi:hypothetical protein
VLVDWDEIADAYRMVAAMRLAVRLDALDAR